MRITRRLGRAGQTITEYILLVGLFAVPLMAYFEPRLRRGIIAFFRTLVWDLSGPGI